MKIDGIKKICLFVLKWAINSEKKKANKLGKKWVESEKRYKKVQETYTVKFEKTKEKCKKKEQQIEEETQRIIQTAKKSAEKAKSKLASVETRVKSELNNRLDTEKQVQRTTLEEKTKHDSEVQRGERLINKIEELFD